VSADKLGKAAQSWINDSYPLHRRAAQWLRGLYYNRVPRHFRPAGLTHFVLKSGLAASAPVLAWLYGTISGGKATIIGAALFFLHSVVSFFDALSIEKNSQTDENDFVLRIGDLLASHKVGGTLQDSDRDGAIRACLGMLEIVARHVTKSRRGEISVSLVQYVGSSRSRMKVRYRNTGNTRPVNREVDANRMLGHNVCVCGALPRVLHDLREIEKSSIQSPTQSKIDYRSIFFLPIKVGEGERQEVKGFVSIDCKRPYAFYGNRAREIVVDCEPILNHIGELIQEATNGRGRQRTSGKRAAHKSVAAVAGA